MPFEGKYTGFEAFTPEKPLLGKLSFKDQATFETSLEGQVAQDVFRIEKRNPYYDLAFLENVPVTMAQTKEQLVSKQAEDFFASLDGYARHHDFDVALEKVVTDLFMVIPDRNEKATFHTGETISRANLIQLSQGLVTKGADKHAKIEMLRTNVTFKRFLEDIFGSTLKLEENTKEIREKIAILGQSDDFHLNLWNPWNFTSNVKVENNMVTYNKPFAEKVKTSAIIGIAAISAVNETNAIPILMGQVAETAYNYGFLSQVFPIESVLENIKYGNIGIESWGPAFGISGTNGFAKIWGVDECVKWLSRDKEVIKQVMSNEAVQEEGKKEFKRRSKILGLVTGTVLTSGAILGISGAVTQHAERQKIEDYMNFLYGYPQQTVQAADKAVEGFWKTLGISLDAVTTGLLDDPVESIDDPEFCEREKSHRPDIGYAHGLNNLLSSPADFENTTKEKLQHFFTELKREVSGESATGIAGSGPRTVQKTNKVLETVFGTEVFQSVVQSGDTIEAWKSLIPRLAEYASGDARSLDFITNSLLPSGKKEIQRTMGNINFASSQLGVSHEISDITRRIRETDKKFGFSSMKSELEQACETRNIELLKYSDNPEQEGTFIHLRTRFLEFSDVVSAELKQVSSQVEASLEEAQLDIKNINASAAIRSGKDYTKFEEEVGNIALNSINIPNIEHMSYEAEVLVTEAIESLDRYKKKGEKTEYLEQIQLSTGISIGIDVIDLIIPVLFLIIVSRGKIFIRKRKVREEIKYGLRSIKGLNEEGEMLEEVFNSLLEKRKQLCVGLEKIGLKDEMLAYTRSQEVLDEMDRSYELTANDVKGAYFKEKDIKEGKTSLERYAADVTSQVPDKIRPLYPHKENSNERLVEMIPGSRRMKNLQVSEEALTRKDVLFVNEIDHGATYVVREDAQGNTDVQMFHDDNAVTSYIQQDFDSHYIVLNFRANHTTKFVDKNIASYSVSTNIAKEFDALMVTDRGVSCIELRESVSGLHAVPVHACSYVKQPHEKPKKEETSEDNPTA